MPRPGGSPRFTMRTLRFLLLAGVCAVAATVHPAARRQPPVPPPVPLAGLSWRAIGPAMFAGRVADVEGVAGNRDLLYVGTASSGLYKSTNGGPGKAGVNRTVWNLAERSPCADARTRAAGRGRGGRGGGRGGGTWLRAIPGEYTVTLAAAGTETRQTFTVRKAPRLTVSDADLAAWHQEATVIVQTQCALQRASADLGKLERHATRVIRAMSTCPDA